MQSAENSIESPLQIRYLFLSGRGTPSSSMPSAWVKVLGGCPRSWNPRISTADIRSACCPFDEHQANPALARGQPGAPGLQLLSNLPREGRDSTSHKQSPREASWIPIQEPLGKLPNLSEPPALHLQDGERTAAEG